MDFLRTPESRFGHLPDFPFEPHFAAVGDDLRMAYVDEGPSDAPPILMMHGEPSWSYLYRKMIPICSAAGHRVIAPDLIGFGRSDKPSKVADYSYQRHVDWVRALLEGLDLRGITLVCQDWGSLIGLRLAAEEDDRFARIVVANGFLPTGDRPMPRAFKIWQAFARWSPWFPIGRIVAMGCARDLTSAERAAYDAPFPSARYKTGARAFPLLVPTTPDNPASPANRQAWEKLGQWRKPFLTTFSTGDPITRGADRVLQKHIPGTAGRQHVKLRGGHFLQEDSGPEFAMAVNRLIEETT